MTDNKNAPEQCGDFLAFHARAYYPYGGLADCVGRFDNLANAWEAIAEAQSDRSGRGEVHVINIENALVYDTPDQTEGLEVRLWQAFRALEFEYGGSIENMSARVAQPNTPETDAMAEVDHIVSWTSYGDATEVTVMASDPTAAVEKVRQLFEGDFQLDLTDIPLVEDEND